MTVKITKITGIGGNPPQYIRVEGEVDGCEALKVTTGCTQGVWLCPISVGGHSPWSLEVPNDSNCSCGSSVDVWAVCSLGAPADAKIKATLSPTNLTLICDPPPPAGCCDEVTITIDTKPLPCYPVKGGTVSVQFSAALSPKGCTGGPFEWKVTNLSTVPQSVIQPFTPGAAIFSYPFAGAGTYKVNVKVQQAGTCDDPLLTHSVTFTINPCTPCSVVVKGPQQTPCTDGAPTSQQTYTATTSSPFAGSYTWEVRNTLTSQLVYQGNGGASFDFPFPGPGTYKVGVSLVTNGCDTASVSDSIVVNVPPCTSPPTTTGHTTDPTPPPTTSDSGFSLCSFLLWLWAILHLAGGSLLYFGLWIPAIIVCAAATIALGIWIGVCCWPCGRTFWRCCALLQWVAMINNVLVAILFGLFVLHIPGVSGVLFAFGLVSTVVWIAMSASNCGSIPNIFDPRTWPPYHC
jgi:hypothetical protein